MANNITIDTLAGGGPTIATQDAGGVHHQKVKVEFDVGGTPTEASSSNPIPVVQTGTVPNDVVEDAAAAGDPTGHMLVARRRDSLAAETTTDGDVTALNCTSKGELHVKHADAVAGTSAASSQADGHSLTLGATADADTATTVIGRLKKLVSLLAAGLPAALGGGGGIKVDGSGTALPVSHAAASEADGHSANIGALADADTASTLTGLLKKVKSLLSGGLPAALGAQGALKVEGVASGTVIPVSGTVTASNTAGDIAHDAADSGNPVKVGAKAVSSLASATLVAAADRANVVVDLDGALIIRPDCPLGDVIDEHVTNTDGNDTACAGAFAAPGAGVSLVLEQIIAVNSSTTNGSVLLKNGVAGTTRATIPIPAAGGVVITLKKPIKLPANTALAYRVSGALSTVSLTFIGYKTKL